MHYRFCRRGRRSFPDDSPGAGGMAGQPWLAVGGGLLHLSTHCVIHAVEVRPYTTDFLLTVLILLAAHAYLNALTLWGQFWGGSGLLLASALAPWLSFPVSSFWLPRVPLCSSIIFTGKAPDGSSFGSS